MLLDALCTALFAVWLVATAVAQIPCRLTDRIRSLDRSQLVPLWTFFAPNPGTTDYHLVYRDLDESGSPYGDWLEIPFPGRTAWSALWNPEKRATKIMNDLAQAMVMARSEIGTVQLTVPYVILLQTVCKAPAGPRAQRREFMIVQTAGWSAERLPELVFKSNPHRLRAA